MRDLSRVLEIYRLPTIHLSVRGEREREKKSSTKEIVICQIIIDLPLLLLL